MRASKVDTGSRGRRPDKEKSKKRKSEEPAPDGSKRQKVNQTQKVEIGQVNEAITKDIGPDGNEALETHAGTPGKEETNPVEAASGFIHLLPPTPENWTNSLPHRTQVVYTPDYSYILHRIRARPGTSIIEAGAGSGSFTHASVRAVFNGYPKYDTSLSKNTMLGKVWSFEFHEVRHEKLQKELSEHGLDGLVEVTHRDVCEEGFLVDGKSPLAEAVFLDLPAPWIALRNLTRSRPPPDNAKESEKAINGEETPAKPFVSPLNPSAPVHICTFSPCIEQVQRTVYAMRKLGWVDISMVEVSQKRLEIRRERIGIDNGAQRGLQTTPASVDEALERLFEVEGNFRTFHETGEKPEGRKNKDNPNNRDKIIKSLVERKVYKEGKLVHRTEPEVKTHTSYLVFAVLPQEWTEEDEAKAKEHWPTRLRNEVGGKEGVDGEVVGMSKRAMKKTARQAQKDKAKAAATNTSASADSPVMVNSGGDGITKTTE